MTPRTAAPATSAKVFRAPAVLGANRRTRASRAAAAVAFAAAALLSGCQLASPIQTNQPYNPADGVPVPLGDVQIRDLVIVADAKGGPGTLSGSLINTGSTAQTVTFADGQSQATAQAKPYSQEPLSGTTQVVIPQVSAPPGGVVQLMVGTQASGATVVAVPVVLPDLYYKTLAPSATTTATQAPSLTQSPSATESPSTTTSSS